MASASYTLLQTIEWAKKMNFNRRSAIGDYMEPALTSANIVKQTVLGPPFRWRWNRVNTGFVCEAGVQDYVLGNRTASTALAVGFHVVDNKGYSQKVTTAGTTGSSAPTWNETPAGTTTDGTVTWTNMGLIGATTSPTYTFSWIETASIQDPTTPPKWYEMDAKISLALDSAPGRPRDCAADGDDGNGNLTFRLMPVPDKAYVVSLTLQQKPTLMSDLNGTWTPIPDEFGYIYNWGFLTLMWMFADDNRWMMANQKFIAHLLGANSGLTETERSIFLNNWSNITGIQVGETNQGLQARGI